MVRSSPLRLVRLLPLLLATLGGSGAPVSGQLGPNESTSGVSSEARDARGAAKAAQAAFERRRVRYLPLGPPVGSTMCDGTVGRFCWWAEDGEWYPKPEDERIVQMRVELITTLDSLQGLAPADDWILGQRVWYRAKSDAWRDATDVARRCPTANEAWCGALEGYALHHGGAYVEAERAFERALRRMDDETRHRWTRPKWPVDSEVRDALEALEGSSDALGVYLETLWLFADPLYLSDGNDRKTGHFARWVATELRRDARNPFRLRWGEDLTQLTVRNGWEVGWERSTGFDYTGVDDAIGRKHPEARDYVPPGDALRWPVESSSDDFVADRTASRSLYAPAYAPVLLPMPSTVSVFPRGATTVLIATQELPEDTTFHATHDHPKPWMDAGEAAGLPDRRGLFALPIGALEDRWIGATARSPLGDTSSGSTGALLLEVPTGTYFVSSESWSPSGRRAGRHRVVVPARWAIDDVATLSDLILVDDAIPSLPASLEAIVPHVRASHRVEQAESIVVAWEVAGLGLRPESLRFELSLQRADRGVLSRVGDFLGLSDPPEPVELTWEESGPLEPGPAFFSLRLDLPAVETGRYRLRLRLHTEGRTPAVQELEVEVVEPTR